MNTSHVLNAQTSLDLGLGDGHNWYFRSIHYLGSKLRLLPQISELIEEIMPNGGPVCDLFSGSGTVSLALSSRRRVVAVDIQEYSRVLCSALLGDFRPNRQDICRFLEELLNSPYRRILTNATSTLEMYEQESLELAGKGNANRLCDIIENGSIISAELSMTEPEYSELSQALRTAILSMCSEPSPYNFKAVVSRHFGGIYFSYQQARELDLALELAQRSQPPARDMFIAAVLSTAIEVVNTVGQQF